LQEQINSTPFHFDEIYSGTVQKFAGITQLMTVSPTNHKTLFSQRLEMAINALKLSQGKIFPSIVSVEERNAHEPRWTYAIFSAGLLQELHTIQDDRIIDYYDQKGVLLSTWSPLLNITFKENTHYLVRWEQPKNAIISSVFITALVMQVIPPRAMQWLNEIRLLANHCFIKSL